MSTPTIGIAFSIGVTSAARLVFGHVNVCAMGFAGEIREAEDY